MRINRYVALATGMSRRSADKVIAEGRVAINGRIASLGDKAEDTDMVTLGARTIKPADNTLTIMLNKPAGYVCSRQGQGSKTIYELLPKEYHRLKPVGRLDKDTSGLILLTDDGELANRLAHPRYQKEKTYIVKLDKKLTKSDADKLIAGVKLEDGLSKFIKLNECSANTYEVVLAEGRNRQIRRTLEVLKYQVLKLHRIKFGPFSLNQKALKEGDYKFIAAQLLF